MRVRVFRNLTRRCLSMQARTPTGWRTIAHAESVVLRDVAFRVSEAGRQRVLATGRKTVHAWAEGDLVEWAGTAREASTWALNFSVGLAAHRKPLPLLPGPLPTPVTYDPRRFRTFVVRHSDAPVVQAQQAVLSIRHGVTIRA